MRCPFRGAAASRQGAKAPHKGRVIMEIKDYVLSEKELAALKQVKRPPVKKVKKTVSRYTVLFQSGFDFGVKKRTGKAVSQLIMMVSQGQYYIRENGEIKKVTKLSLKKFLKEMEKPLKLPDVSWITGLSYDAQLIGELSGLCRDDKIAAHIKQDIYYAYSSAEYDPPSSFCRIGEEDAHVRQWHFVDEMALHGDMYSALLSKMIRYMADRRGISVKELYQSVLCMEQGKKERLALGSVRAFIFISNLYGDEWALKMLEQYMGSNIRTMIDEGLLIILFDATLKDGGGSYRVFSANFGSMNHNMPISFANPKASRDRQEKAYINKLRKNCIFSPDKFSEYLFTSSVSQGFAFETDEFLCTWRKFITLQKNVYGKIKDKYPRNIVSEFKRLRYRERIHSEEIDRKLWKEASKKMKKLEYGTERYAVIAPSCKEDMQKESRELHSCVDGYAEKVVRGEEMILFMRDKSNIQSPLITIELFNNGQIGQIFGICNRDPDTDEMSFISKWAEEKNLRLPETRYAPRAAYDVDPDEDEDDEDPLLDESFLRNGNPFLRNGANTAGLQNCFYTA